MSRIKSKKAAKAYVITMAVIVLFLIFKYSSESFLHLNDIHYRTWVDLLAAGLLWLILPGITIYYITWLLLPRKKFFAILIMMAAVLYYFFFLLIQFLMFENIYEKEKRMGDLLQGTTELFLDKGQGQDTCYYKNATLFTKEICRDDKLIVETFMEDKYKDEFKVTALTKNENHVLYAKGTFESMPELEIGVSAASIYYYFREDRNMAQAYMRIQEYCEKENITRKIVPVYETENIYLSDIKIYCTYDELAFCAEETAGMIAYILEDVWFRNGASQRKDAGREERGGKLTVICGKEENTYNQVTLKFGDFYGAERDYYAKKENVYQTLEEVFRDNIYTMTAAEPEEDSAESAENELETGRDSETDRKEDIIQIEGFTTPESAGEQLYEEIFKSQGTEFLPAYNAKGNFYAELGTGEEELSGEMYETRHTIVYDRQSKNGKCQLFAEYKDYMKTEGNETYVYTTAILNIYAVNMVTGEITAAGKTAWDQVGSKEYQEMTGEY